MLLGRVISYAIRPRIYVILRGGLGNQLYQIAAGVHLAEKYGGKLIIFPHIVDTAKNHDRRGFYKKIDLSGLFPKIKIHEVNRIEDFVLRVMSRVSLRRFQKRIVSEENFFNASIYQIMLIVGWFQSHEYLPVNIDFTKLADPLLKSKKETKLHVRLTDFLDIDKHPLDGHFYKEALKKLQEKHNFSDVICFSDDIPNAIKILPPSFTYIFPEIENSLKANELLSALSSSYALICSKSSLCWWAANAVGSQGGIVISPWTEKAHKSSWLKIDN
jgi:hypothetical protein